MEKLLKIASLHYLCFWLHTLLMAASQVGNCTESLTAASTLRKAAVKIQRLVLIQAANPGSRWGLREEVKIWETDILFLSNWRMAESLITVKWIKSSAAAPEGRMFGREATLNFHTPYGTIGMGRMGGLLSGMGTYGLMGTNSSPFAAAWSDAKYNLLFTAATATTTQLPDKSPTFNNLTLYAQYSFNADGPEYETWRDNSEMAGVAATPFPVLLLLRCPVEILASVKTD